jgi:hypothetical protein
MSHKVSLVNCFYGILSVILYRVLLKTKLMLFLDIKAIFHLRVPQTSSANLLHKSVADALLKRDLKISQICSQAQGKLLPLSTYSIYIYPIKIRFNAQTISREDPSLHSITHKYGKETWPRPHPCIDQKPWSSTFRESFKQPESRFRPNHRTKTSIGAEQFDPAMKDQQRGPAA